MRIRWLRRHPRRGQLASEISAERSARQRDLEEGVARPAVGSGGAMSAWTRHALGNPTRRRILRRLTAGAPGTLSGAHLGAALELPAGVVEYHLRVLADAGLLSLRSTAAGSRVSFAGADPSVQDALARSSTSDEAGPK